MGKFLSAHWFGVHLGIVQNCEKGPLFRNLVPNKVAKQRAGRRFWIRLPPAMAKHQTALPISLVKGSMISMASTLLHWSRVPPADAKYQTAAAPR